MREPSNSQCRAWAFSETGPNIESGEARAPTNLVFSYRSSASSEMWFTLSTVPIQEYHHKRRSCMSVFLMALRWLARLSGLVLRGFFVLLMVGESAQPHPNPPSTLQEWTGPMLLGSGCV